MLTNMDPRLQLNPLPINMSFKIPFREKDFRVIVRRRENAGGQHFLPFPHCFQAYHRQKSTVERLLFVVCKHFPFG